MSAKSAKAFLFVRAVFERLPSSSARAFYFGGGFAFQIGGVGVGASFQKQQHGAGLGRARCSVQRRLSIVVLDGDIGLSLQKQCAKVGAAAKRRFVKGRASGLGLRVHACVGVKKSSGRGDRSFCGDAHQRREARIVRQIEVRAAGDQKFNRSVAPRARRRGQGGELFVFDAERDVIDILALVEGFLESARVLGGGEVIPLAREFFQFGFAHAVKKRGHGFKGGQKARRGRIEDAQSASALYIVAIGGIHGKGGGQFSRHRASKPAASGGLRRRELCVSAFVARRLAA